MYDRDLSHYRALDDDEEPALLGSGWVGPILDPDDVAKKIGRPFDDWAYDCHTVSLAIVKSTLLPDLGFPDRRVARGHTAGVSSQHSWVALSQDCYDRTVPVVDPTLWSYRDDVTGIYVGSPERYRHVPHGGNGVIWGAGRPPKPKGDVLALPAEVFAALSPVAQRFLELCGPLDWHGWSFLCNAPVAGWPAAEIIAAMDGVPQLTAIVPVDRLGMLTDRNPGKLYLP